MPRDSVPYNGLFSTTVIVRSKIGNQTNVRRNGDSYSGVAREHSEIQKPINVFITPVWISRHRRLTSSPSSLNQFRRFTYKSVNKSSRYKSCQSLYCPFSVTAAMVQFIFNLYLHVWLHNVGVLWVGSCFVWFFPLCFCFKEEIATSDYESCQKHSSAFGLLVSLTFLSFPKLTRALTTDFVLNYRARFYCWNSCFKWCSIETSLGFFLYFG